MGPGGGVANCQYGAGPYETLDVVSQSDGTVTIGSTTFSNVFLRMDGRDVIRPMDAGSGVVNAQFGVGPYEKFVISNVTQGLSEQDLRHAIETYGPVLKFHPNEIYNLCSIEAFLQHATLHDKNTGAEINHPTVAQLPTGTNNDGRYWLILEDGYKGGDLATAKAYVHAYWRPGMSWTDLQFWFFYAYNGRALRTSTAWCSIRLLTAATQICPRSASISATGNVA
jgi:Vacuolar protein sorting-associated protein 62